MFILSSNLLKKNYFIPIILVLSWFGIKFYSSSLVIHLIFYMAKILFFSSASVYFVLLLEKIWF